jgi:hypothetical protein
MAHSSLCISSEPSPNVSRQAAPDDHTPTSCRRTLRAGSGLPRGAPWFMACIFTGRRCCTDSPDRERRLFPSSLARREKFQRKFRLQKKNCCAYAPPAGEMHVQTTNRRARRPGGGSRHFLRTRSCISRFQTIHPRDASAPAILNREHFACWGGCLVCFAQVRSTQPRHLHPCRCHCLCRRLSLQTAER